MPSLSQMYTGMVNSAEANNLVNFYNSNLLDEMLSKNQSKFSKHAGQGGSAAVQAHLRKSAQTTLSNHSSNKPQMTN